MKRLDTLLGAVPMALIEAFGRNLGRLAFWLDGRHRRIVQQNLTFVFPERSRAQIHALSRGVFEHFGIMVLETLQVPFLSRSQLERRVRIENEAILLEAMDHPKGCLLVSFHLGNWELGMLAAAAHLNRSVLTVAKPVKSKMVHRWLTALRSRFGNGVVFKKGAMSAMMKSLRAGRTVAILIDQGVRRREAVEISFLGRRAMATPAAALLALRGRMPVVPMTCVRDARGVYTIDVKPPVVFERSGDLHKDVRVYTQLLIDSLESAVRACPHQWFWFHKRWKRTYPDLYPQYQIRRRRKRLKKGLDA